jgi:hypothetical protein
VATVATQGQSIIVDTPDSVPGAQSVVREQPGHELVSWIVSKVSTWRDHRDRGYQKKWAEYWRMWRGQWSEEDRNRLSERSRLIAPALAQSIEQTVSEVDEAVFGKEVWFDIVDDIADEDKTDALFARDMLLEDLSTVGAPDALSEAVLNAAIFGTGIVKISVEVAEQSTPQRNKETQALEAYSQERVYVCVDSVRPDEFIPDPAGRSVPEMLGAAHDMQKRPMHATLEKIEKGIYRKDALKYLSRNTPSHGQEIDYNDPEAQFTATDTDSIDVLEYHGKVPAKFLEPLLRDAQGNATVRSELDEYLDQGSKEEQGDGPLIEAIVTIANEGVLLRAMANPFTMKDRSLIAFQFEKVPGRFWGRGVSEKGYNPQKALDAEIRARIDALGFVSSPMLGVDSGRIPRGFKMEIKPGKIWLTQGNPDEVLRPVGVGDINPATFNQASEMERMVQMGTGAFDTATSLKSQSQSGSNSLSANSMLMGAFVKRAKRAIGNVDRNLLQPVIKKVMWRYMQFDPVRYPKDTEFQVKAALGIVAREVEAMQMTQLIGMMPEQFGAVTLTLTQGLIEHSAIPNKAQILQQINEALKPPSEEEQAKQKQLADMQFEAAKGQAQQVLLENQKLLAEMRKLLAEAAVKAKEADQEDDKLIQEQLRIQIQFEELKLLEDQNRLAMQKLNLEMRKLDQKIAQDGEKHAETMKQKRAAK